jgi:hypothetical protein
MTLAEVLRALVRRWPLTAAGLLLSLAAAYFGTNPAPVYHARTEMVLLAPSSARYPNELVTQTQSLIVTAGAVAGKINGPDVQIRYGSSLVNPIGAPGNGKDTWINLIDTGTQWVPVYEDQILLVDAVGDDPRIVTQRIDAAAQRVQDELRTLQKTQKVDAANYITARMSPTQPVVEEVKGSRVRAIGMTVAIGMFLTVTVVLTLEVRSRTSRKRLPAT